LFNKLQQNIFSHFFQSVEVSNMQYSEQRIKDQEYRIGCIIKRKASLFADQCGVLIGWDTWLRPLVLAITRKTQEEAVHFAVLTLDEFEQGNGSKVIYTAAETEPHCREETLTDALWSRTQRLLKTGLNSSDLINPDCESIARFLVTGMVCTSAPRPAPQLLRQSRVAR
jgi:hypothetical protein